MCYLEDLNSQTNLKIFLIDDDPSILSIYSKLLRKNGYFTITASCAADALEIIDRGLTQVNVIVSDINMPDLNGFDLHRQVEARNSELAKKIIFITGGIYTEEMKALSSRLPNLTLNKPVNIEALLQAITQVMRVP